jgi:hypothetical protein
MKIDACAATELRLMSIIKAGYKPYGVLTAVVDLHNMQVTLSKTPTEPKPGTLPFVAYSLSTHPDHPGMVFTQYLQTYGHKDTPDLTVEEMDEIRAAAAEGVDNFLNNDGAVPTDLPSARRQHVATKLTFGEVIA